MHCNNPRALEPARGGGEQAQGEAALNSAPPPLPPRPGAHTQRSGVDITSASARVAGVRQLSLPKGSPQPGALGPSPADHLRVPGHGPDLPSSVHWARPCCQQLSTAQVLSSAPQPQGSAGGVPPKAAKLCFANRRKVLWLLTPAADKLSCYFCGVYGAFSYFSLKTQPSRLCFSSMEPKILSCSNDKSPSAPSREALGNLLASNKQVPAFSPKHLFAPREQSCCPGRGEVAGAKSWGLQPSQLPAGSEGTKRAFIRPALSQSHKWLSLEGT